MPESYEEHNKKNEVDQESVTKNEVQEKLKRKAWAMEARLNKQRLKIIDDFIKSQFQPLTFSVESDPLLGASMRPYIDSLREQTRNAALTDWATALSPSAETSLNDSFRMLRETVPPQKYVDIVGKLAQEMWMNAGPSSQAFDFWLSAERRVVADTLRMFADTRRMFADVRRMFAGTRKRAYYIWETLGEPRGHSMDDWLQAEAQALTL